MFHELWELERFQTSKKRPSRSFKGICNGAIRLTTYNFLLVFHCTIFEILSLFRSNISCMHFYSSVSISTQSLKCLASPITKIWWWQNLTKRVTTLTTPLLGVVCQHRPGFDTVYLHAKFDDSSFSRSRDITGASRDHDHAPFKGDLLYLCWWDLTQPTCMQNLTTLASAIPEIWLVPIKI